MTWRRPINGVVLPAAKSEKEKIDKRWQRSSCSSRGINRAEQSRRRWLCKQALRSKNPKRTFGLCRKDREQAFALSPFCSRHPLGTVNVSAFPSDPHWKNAPNQNSFHSPLTFHFLPTRNGSFDYRLELVPSFLCLSKQIFVFVWNDTHTKRGPQVTPLGLLTIRLLFVGHKHNFE